MTASLDSHVLLRALMDELARCGLRHACTSPGSRSAPIVLALAREARIRCWSHLDERVSGFFALGLARATEAPVVVTCTSGTAAANLAPAIQEAHEAGVALIVLTADRPPELRAVGAGQAIDQIKLYGSAVKLFCEVGVDRVTPQTLRWIRGLACRAYWTAAQGAAGPVHLNFPLRDPLVPDGPLPDDVSGRPDGAPRVARPHARPDPGPQAVARLTEAVDATPRGIVVCGRPDTPTSVATVAAVVAFARRAGYPLLADPLGGARVTGAAVAHYDALLRDPAFAEEHRPHLVVRVGDLPTSKPLRAWLAAAGDVAQIALDPNDRRQDPDTVVTTALAMDAARLAEVAAVLVRPPDERWVSAWMSADACAAAAIAAALGDELSEPRVAAELGSQLAPPTTLFVASSMPVRDVETFFATRPEAVGVLSNRGANGIDGTIASALGVAAAKDGPVVLLIGDVAFAYDATALISARRLGVGLTIVLVDNDGGGIFHFLPIADQADIFEDQIATPHGLDFAALSAGLGATHQRARDPASLRTAVAASLETPGVQVIEVRTERTDNVALHRDVSDAVAVALAAARG